MQTQFKIFTLLKHIKYTQQYTYKEKYLLKQVKYLTYNVHQFTKLLSMSNLCIQQYNTLFFPPMFFFLMFCYLYRPISFELLIDFTLISNPIGVTSTALDVLLDVCICMANICLRSTCTELTWIVNSCSMKDLNMLLERTFGNKLFIASFTLESLHMSLFVLLLNQ